VPDRTGEHSPDRKGYALTGQSLTRWECPRCGFEASNDDPPNFFRPWHIRGPNAVRDYVESLGEEAREWLMALYVDFQLNLMAVDTIARGDIGSCGVPFGKIISRGHQLGAEGFILVHNHPSGDPTPSETDIKTTVRLARVSRDCDLPMLCHYVITKGEMRTVGYW
jgi:DNA repair protein RadC